MADDHESSSTPLVLAALAGIVGLAILGWFLFGGTSEAHVTGLVTYRQQPVASAKVVFLRIEENNRFPYVVPTDDDGRFRIVGPAGRGIPPGRYKVMVTKEGLADGSRPEGSKFEDAQNANLFQNLLPKIYEEVDTTPLQFDLAAGTHFLPLELLPP